MTTPKEFPKFRKLPQEIQDMIWKAAMRGPINGFHALHFRPCLPGRNRNDNFGTFIYGYNDDSAVARWLKLDRGDWNGPLNVQAMVESPKYPCQDLFDASGEFFRRDNFRATNLSLYLEDAALWNTCKDSRRVMNRFHRRVPRNVPQPATQAALISPTTNIAADTIAPGAGKVNQARSDAPQATIKTQTREAVVMGAFSTRQNEAWVGHNDMIFHIMSEDLVCVQCDWSSQFAALGPGFTRAICKALKGVKHLAVEFERHMLRSLYYDGPDELIEHGDDTPSYTLQWHGGFRLTSVISPFFKSALQNHEDDADQPPRTIWFIDPIIKRTPNGRAAGEAQGGSERAVFHGNGCKFTEVRLGDQGWTAPSMEPGHVCSVVAERPFLRGKPFMLSSMECGAHCGIKRLMTKLVSRNQAQGMTKTELFEWFQKGPVRVLAVEYEETRWEC